MSQKKKESTQKTEIDSFLSDVKQTSIENMLKAGVILPQLRPELEKVYTMTVLSLPKSFTSDYGLTHAFDVDYEGMKHSIITPISFKTQLVAEMYRKSLTKKDNDGNEKPDFSQLIGKILKVKKVIGDTKEYKKAKLYTVEIQ